MAASPRASAADSECLAGVPQILVDVEQAGSGADPLDADVAEPALEVAQQSGLDLGPGSQVGVATLGGKGPIAGAVPYKESLAQPRAGGDHCLGAPGYRLADVEWMQIGRSQDRHGAGDRLEVVEQAEPSGAPAPRRDRPRRGAQGRLVTWDDPAITGPATAKLARSMVRSVPARNSRTIVASEGYFALGYSAWSSGARGPCSAE